MIFIKSISLKYEFVGKVYPQPSPKLQPGQTALQWSGRVHVLCIDLRILVTSLETQTHIHTFNHTTTAGWKHLPFCGNPVGIDSLSAMIIYSTPYVTPVSLRTVRAGWFNFSQLIIYQFRSLFRCQLPSGIPAAPAGTAQRCPPPFSLQQSNKSLTTGWRQLVEVCQRLSSMRRKSTTIRRVAR